MLSTQTRGRRGLLCGICRMASARFFQLMLLCPVLLSAQQPPAKPAAGMASAGPHAAEYDALHRPITAGGFVTSGPLLFEDVAAKAGLASWHHESGTPEKKLILEAKGPGVCLIDYDHDGWLDVYLVNGTTYAALAGKAASPHAALFHNNHDGSFTEVTAKAGVANDRWGYGCVVADYDNDGWPDLYVTNYGQNRLYHNNHDGTFTDLAPQAGVGLGGWSAGATFGDYDGDGRLDLFVAGYAQIDLNDPPVAGTKSAGFTLCQYRGVQVMCGPRGLKGEHDHLFHNNGDGTFTDVSLKLGVDDPAGFYGLGALFADVNNDGKPDLLVANDSTPNYLYLNKGNGSFEDVSYLSGYALNEAGREVANMGIAAGDYENNGHLSLVNTTFSDDYNVLFQNDGTATFNDVSFQAGIAQSSIPFVGFADGFLDYDNDGWLDLLILNGHVYPEVDKHPEWGQSYAQRPLLYHNVGKGKFALVPAVEGSGLAVVSVGRGAAFGDLFNDGKIAVVVNNMDGVPVLLKNVSKDTHHWVELALTGGPKSPRDAVGATVYLVAAAAASAVAVEGQGLGKDSVLRQRGDVLSGGSYLSSNDLRVHFGLADRTRAGTAEIHWPSGAVELVALPTADRIYSIMEGKGITATDCYTCTTKR